VAATAGVAVVVVVPFAEHVNVAVPEPEPELAAFGPGGSPGAYVVTLTCEQDEKKH